MHPYQPSQKVETRGFIWLLCSALIGGTAIGGSVWLVSLFIYLILLFPWLMGKAGGFVMATGVRRGKVRSPQIAAVFSGLAGLVIYGTLQAGDYVSFRLAASEEIRREIGEVDQGDVDQIIDVFLQEETGSTGVLGYLKLSAQEGIGINRAGSSQAGISITGVGVWIYWAVELALIEYLMIVAAVAAAQAPFCEKSGQWYGERNVIGSVRPDAADAFLQQVNTQHFRAAGALISPVPGLSPQGLLVSAQQSSDVLADQVLTISRISGDEQGKRVAQDLKQGMISTGQMHQLQQAVDEARQIYQQENPHVDEATIRLAQQERATVTASDRWVAHGLPEPQLSDLVQQLSSNPKIKAAYLVQKQLQHLPDQPLYVLGIERKRDLIESESSDQTFVNQLGSQLRFSGDLWIAPLNKDKAMRKALQKVEPTPIYQRGKA